MLEGKIKLRGRTREDVEYAIEEALRSIRNGSTSGFDHNESSSYSFTIDGGEELPNGDRTWILSTAVPAGKMHAYLRAAGAPAVEVVQGQRSSVRGIGAADAPPPWMARFAANLRTLGIEHALD